MTDPVTRKEFDALKERVAELESGQSGGRSTGGLDHRDRSVLDALRERDDRPSPLEVVELYKKHTDITTPKTAKRRAKQLSNRDEFTEALEA